MRCPFGCSQSHRRQQRSIRSAAYYRSKEGRIKKRDLNRKRYLTGENDDIEQLPLKIIMDTEAVITGVVRYVRLVVSLIEGYWISLDEIKKMLRRISRQHSLSKQNRNDYIIGQLNENSP